MTTPRRELVADAVRKLRKWEFERRFDLDRFGLRTAHDAIEAVIDEWRGVPSNRAKTIIDYYRTASERAMIRLINEVGRKVRDAP